MESTQTNNTVSSTVKILPATPDDAEAIHACSMKTMETNYLQSKVYPKEKAHLTTTEEFNAWRVRRVRKAMEADDHIYMKAVSADSPDVLVGFASWITPGYFKQKTLTETFGKSTIDGQVEDKPEASMTSSDAPENAVTSEQQNEGFPACIDVEVHRGVLAKTDEEREKIWAGDANYWYLGALVVHPDYQRKGVGTMLIKVGLEWADRDGLPTFVEASPQGAQMYPKFGFEKVSELVMFEGRYVMEYHIRAPAMAR